MAADLSLHKTCMPLVLRNDQSSHTISQRVISILVFYYLGKGRTLKVGSLPKQEMPHKSVETLAPVPRKAPVRYCYVQLFEIPFENFKIDCC